MENFSYHVPFYIVTGGVATQGHSSELTSGKVGLIDRQTWSVATTAGNGKEFFFAQGNIGGLDWNGNRVTETHKSPYFYAKNVSNIYKSLPARLVNEEWVIGFDGSDSSRGFTWKKGKTVSLKFVFSGDPIYRKFGGPKEYRVSYTVPADCVDPNCVDNCNAPELDCRPSTVKLIDLINKHVELQQFGVSAKLVSNLFVAGVPDMTKYCLSLCDEGNALALAAVQAQVPVGARIERTSRVGSVSTYQFCQKTTATAPTAFTQTGSVLLATCGSCAAFPGSTLVAAKDIYIVKRPLSGSEVLVTDADKQAYATAVGTSYGVSVVADKSFLGQDGAVALVKIQVAPGTVVTAVLADTIEFVGAQAATCTLAAPATIAWVSCGTGISSTRTLKTKLARVDCAPTGDRIAELTALLSKFPSVNIGSLTKIAGTACIDEYTVTQNSSDCLDEGCLTENVSFHYTNIPSLDAAIFEEVVIAGVDNLTRKCGIRVTAGYIDPKFGNCSFDPKDYYNDEPIKFELAVFDEFSASCDYKTLPTAFRTRVGTIQRQTGEYVVREVLMKDEAYLRHIKQFDMDQRTREAFDLNLLDSVDRKAFYTLYYVSFTDSYHGMDRKTLAEKFTAVFAFKEGSGDAAIFESGPIALLSGKSGVGLHINA